MERGDTIKEIAARAGVSTAMVSNVIHGKTRRGSTDTARSMYARAGITAWLISAFLAAWKLDGGMGNTWRGMAGSRIRCSGLPDMV